MRAYLISTGALFGLLTVLHVWRAVVERHLVSDPWFILATLVAAGMGLWALFLLRSRAGSP